MKLQKKLMLALLLFLIIGLHFFWSSSAYIAQMYQLSSKLAPEIIDKVALRYNYFAQAIGALFLLFFLSKKPYVAASKKVYLLLLALSGLSTLIMFISSGVFLIIICGILMNLTYGAINALQMVLIVSSVPVQYRGRVFGFSYAFGSLLSYYLSLANQKLQPSLPMLLLFYLVMICINALLYLLYRKEEETLDPSMLSASIHCDDKEAPPSVTPIKFFSLILLIFVLLNMSMINSISGNFKSAALFQSGISLEYSRLFYAFGLLLAGILSDYSRRAGAFVCLFSLFYPFIGLLLSADSSLLALTWQLSYFFLGFYTIYRSLVFIDLPRNNPQLFYFAGLGFVIARFGEIFITFLPPDFYTQQLQVTLVIISLMLPILALFIILYPELYHPELHVIAQKDLQ